MKIEKGRNTGISMGRFKINKKIIDAAVEGDEEELKILKAILQDVVVLKVESMMF